MREYQKLFGYKEQRWISTGNLKVNEL